MTIRRGDILWADLGMFPTTSVQGGCKTGDRSEQ